MVSRMRHGGSSAYMQIVMAIHPEISSHEQHPKATANASSAAVDVKATAKAKKLHASSLGDGIGTIVDAVPERELAFVKKNPQSCFLIIACGEEEETESAITSTTIEAYLVQPAAGDPFEFGSVVAGSNPPVRGAQTRRLTPSRSSAG